MPFSNCGVEIGRSMFIVGGSSIMTSKSFGFVEIGRCRSFWEVVARFMRSNWDWTRGECILIDGILVALIPKIFGFSTGLEV